MTVLKTLYEDDTVAWAESQAAALRAAARGGSNQALDWENLAEEIEDLSKSIKRAVHSHIRHIVEHLIKLEHSAARSPREGWRESIQNARVEIDALLDESPSLRPQLDTFIDVETPRATRLAIGSLKARGELSRSLQQVLARKGPVDLFRYSREQILGDWFPPEPEGPQGAE